MQEIGLKDGEGWFWGLRTPGLQHDTVGADLRAHGSPKSVWRDFPSSPAFDALPSALTRHDIPIHMVGKRWLLFSASI
jgi:hypothetical protein